MQCFQTFPTTINAFIFRHVIKDHAATECVDVVIRFAHGHAIKDYAYGCVRETVWASFGGHGEKIWRGTDMYSEKCQSFSLVCSHD
jgi:hypothetical protein